MLIQGRLTSIAQERPERCLLSTARTNRVAWETEHAWTSGLHRRRLATAGVFRVLLAAAIAFRGRGRAVRDGSGVL